ncbi:hypothetical protein B7494_g7440 [Chlorociboria aeruginascens]|nr:hypothetical protein B7494_g7440 [Chlorociboria aeruginascens]
MSEKEITGLDPIVIDHDGTGEPLPAPAATTRRPWWKLGGRDISFTPVDPASTSTSNPASIKDDVEGGENNIHETVFDDSRAAEFYLPVEKYEGRHRFDPKATWAPQEEQKLLDWRICLPACIMFFALQLDRTNISQALSDNMLDDLNMTTNDYNNGMSIFYCSFLFAELPSQLISKKIGPDNWIPVVAICQMKITGRTTFYLTRFLLGLLEGLYLPPSPTQTKSTGIKGILRGKNGWFSERQEVVMVTRILRDDPGKSTMHNRQAISPKLLWESLSDYDLWPIYLIGLTWTIPMTPPQSYLTLTLKALGFSTFNTNLLVIPSSVLFIIQLLFWTWLSEKINQRFLVGLGILMYMLYLIYQNNDKPLYYTGNKVLLALAAYNVCLFIGAKIFYEWKNQKRDQLWDAMSREEKLYYLATTKDKGNKRLDFRFAT